MPVRYELKNVSGTDLAIKERARKMRAKCLIGGHNSNFDPVALRHGGWPWANWRQGKATRQLRI